MEMLAGHRRRQSQESLLERVAGLLAKRKEQSDIELPLIDDILIELVRDAEITMRAKIADQIAGLDNLPPNLTDWLLNDEPEVAKSLIWKGRQLTEDQLIRAAQKGTRFHRLIVAARPHLESAVGECLVSFGEVDVAMCLLENETANISQQAFMGLVDMAKDDDVLAAPLLERPDLGTGIAHRLFWVVSNALRVQILDRFPVKAEDIDAILARMAKSGIVGLEEPLEAAREKVAQRLSWSQVVGALKAGDDEPLVQDLAQRLGIRAACSRRILEDWGGEPLAIACKAAECTMTEFGQVYLLADYRRTGMSRPASDLERIAKLFSYIPAARARDTVTLWDKIGVAA